MIVVALQGMEGPLRMAEATSSMELGADMEAAMPVVTRAMGVSKATDMETQGVAMAAEGSETRCVSLPREANCFRAVRMETLPVPHLMIKSLHCKLSMPLATLQSLRKMCLELNLTYALI